MWISRRDYRQTMQDLSDERNQMHQIYNEMQTLKQTIEKKEKEIDRLSALLPRGLQLSKMPYHQIKYIAESTYGLIARQGDYSKSSYIEDILYEEEELRKLERGGLR